MTTVVSQRFIFFNSSSSTTYIQEPTFITTCIDPTTFTITRPGMYYRYWLSSLIFKNDFQSINTTNNQILFNGTPVFLNVGKPSIQDVVSNLNALGITCSYNDDTNQLIFSTTTPYTLDFTSPKSAAQLLGFVEGQVYTITDGFIPPNQVNLSIDLIYIRSNYGDTNYAVVNDTTVNTSILGTISLLAMPYDVVEFVDSTGQYMSIERTRTDIQNITLSFTDINEKFLTLNSDFSCNLCIQFCYDYQPDILQALEKLNQSIIQLVNLESRKQILDSIKEQKEKKDKKHPTTKK